MSLEHSVWLEHFWFTLETIAIKYPTHPTNADIKKYYHFIVNIPLFFPMDPLGKNFIKILDKYPVNPYLSTRLSFMKWVHFIKTHIYKILNKDYVSFDEHIDKYYEHYKPKDEKIIENLHLKKRIIEIAFIIGFIGLCYYSYKK
jgi:hypothetical protein|tara:strand:+ start:72 stop:503 length:432 start_codon:yes stop_codon:yes gene_type:complete